MKYRNKATGAVIDIKSRLSGGEWEELKEAKKASGSSRKKKASEQDGSVCENK